MSGASLRRLVAALAVTLAVGSRAPSPATAEAGARLEISASRQGFQPKSLTLRRGETAQLVLSSLDGEHCFAVDALRIEKRIVPGRATRVEITPERTGVFAFHCCLESGDAARVERGQLTVAD